MYDLVTGAGVVLGPAVGGFLVCSAWMLHRQRRQSERAAAAARDAVLQRTADLRRPAEWGPIQRFTVEDHQRMADIRLVIFHEQAATHPESMAWFGTWLSHWLDDGALSGVAA